MRRTLFVLAALATGVALGCVAAQRQQWSMDTPAPGTCASTGEDPAVGQHVAPTALQNGLITTAVQGLTGINYQQALPWGFMPLLALQSFLSHRREMARIRASAYAPVTRGRSS